MTKFRQPQPDPQANNDLTSLANLPPPSFGANRNVQVMNFDDGDWNFDDFDQEEEQNPKPQIHVEVKEPVKAHEV